MPDPYPTWRLGAIRGACVGVIEAKLSAIDVALAALDGCPDNRVVLLSRRTGLPNACAPYRHVELAHLDGSDASAALDRLGASLRTAALLFDREFAAQGIGLTLRTVLTRKGWLTDDALASRVYGVLASTNRVVPEIWHRLPDGERERFCRRWQPAWNHVRVPVPPVNRQRIDRAIREGRLIQQAGLGSIRPAGSGFEVEAGGATLSVDWVVNASGFSRRPAGPLLERLLRAGWARESPFGGIEVSFTTCEVQGRSSRASLFAVGHATAGDYLSVSNIDVIQLQVLKIVDAIERHQAGQHAAVWTGDRPDRVLPVPWGTVA